MLQSDFQPSAADVQTSRATPRLPFIDGLRGAAAFYVVLYHCYFIEITASNFQKTFSPPQRALLHWLGYGEEAMSVFLVISGFCLMREVLHNGGALRGGALRFFWRRARRLLPPYFIMLALLLPLIAAFPLMDRINVDLFGGSQAPNLSGGVLLSHALLIDNLEYAWKFGIDPPSWGVATMGWMYLLFALILLPVWRRMGSMPLILLAIAIGLLPHFLRHSGDDASPWFMGIFALGMGAAELCRAKSAINPRKAFAWLIAALAILALLLGIGFFKEELIWEHIFAVDLTTGCATACGLIGCCGLNQEVNRPLVLKLLESRPLNALGKISYSLFLAHFPVLWALHAGVVQRLNLQPLERLFTLLAIGVPATLLAAWIFEWVIERRFRVTSVA